jgi:DNA primase small subunit
MFDWLSYGNDDTTGSSQIVDKDFFPKREWSFTIEDDIYIRYQSFKDKSEFVAAIQKRQPHKIDIGAVFSAPPKDHTTIKPELFKTVERELVFDIDMTDYDNIRKCCTGANICRRCWPYMTMAVKVIDERLRSDYGFRNILWIYGRLLYEFVFHLIV